MYKKYRKHFFSNWCGPLSSIIDADSIFPLVFKQNKINIHIEDCYHFFNHSIFFTNSLRNSEKERFPFSKLFQYSVATYLK